MTSAPKSLGVAVLLSGTLAATALVPAAGALPPGGAKTQTRGAKVSLDKYRVKAGSKIKVRGWNWKAKGSRIQKGAKVTVKIDDNVIIGVFPIRNKRFSGYVTIPRQVRSGRHWLRFLAAEPATSVKSKSFTVTR